VKGQGYGSDHEVFATYHPARHLLFAILILVLGHWLIKVVNRWTERAMTRAQVEPTVTRFVTHVSYFILLTVVVIIALGQLGIHTTSLLALLSAAGLAIGLALQGSLANFAAGLLLILFRPIRQGDFIAAAGVEGTVQDVQMLVTTLYTVDNLRLTVPNAKITEGVITNYSVTPTRPIQLTVGVSYDADLQQVKHVLEALIAEEPRVLKEPAPFIGISNLGESSVDVTMQVWVQRADVRQVRSGFLEKIKLAFEQRGIRIPYPQRTGHLQNGTNPTRQHAEVAQLPAPR
jgi:small conductance mechanosensitive channel